MNRPFGGKLQKFTMFVQEGPEWLARKAVPNTYPAKPLTKANKRWCVVLNKWALIDRHGTWILCKLLGHHIIDDHCGQPEHRYCLWCWRTENEILHKVPSKDNPKDC